MENLQGSKIEEIPICGDEKIDGSPRATPVFLGSLVGVPLLPGFVGRRKSEEKSPRKKCNMLECGFGSIITIRCPKVSRQSTQSISIILLY